MYFVHMEWYSPGVNMKMKDNDRKRREKTCLPIKGQADFVSKLLLKASKNMRLVMPSQTETRERIMLLLPHCRDACLTGHPTKPH